MATTRVRSFARVHRDARCWRWRLSCSWLKVVYDGKTPPPGAAVAPDERLWSRTVGLGAQHVVAMFGATFVFPIIMGLNPNLAILMSGIATIVLPADRQGRGAQLPRHVRLVRGRRDGHLRLGRRWAEDVTGAILVAGVVLAMCGVIIHFLGSDVVNGPCRRW